MRKTFMAAGAAMMIAAPAHAEKDVPFFVTANALYEACQSDAQKQFCYGFIGGAVDSFETFRSLSKLSPCLRANASVVQIKDLVLNYYRDHPEKRDFSAAPFVVLSLGAGFCPDSMPAGNGG